MGRGARRLRFNTGTFVFQLAFRVGFRCRALLALGAEVLYLLVSGRVEGTEWTIRREPSPGAREERCIVYSLYYTGMISGDVVASSRSPR